MMADIASLMPQQNPAEGAEGGAPQPSDPTGTGAGNVAPGAAPTPNEAGFTGGGGGANGGNAPSGGQAAPQQAPTGT
jgi:hypothetical protein